MSGYTWPDILTGLVRREGLESGAATWALNEIFAGRASEVQIAALLTALRAKGELYHIHHPFHRAMYEGRATREQIQGWVANRFYYQICIPRKDAAIIANMPDREHRRLWVQRILDHDGDGDFEGHSAGGIETWTRLGEAVGIDREDLWSLRRVVPAVRFACDQGGLTALVR